MCIFFLFSLLLKRKEKKVGLATNTTTNCTTLGGKTKNCNVKKKKKTGFSNFSDCTQESIIYVVVVVLLRQKGHCQTIHSCRAIAHCIINYLLLLPWSMQIFYTKVVLCCVYRRVERASERTVFVRTHLTSRLYSEPSRKINSQHSLILYTV